MCVVQLLTEALVVICRELFLLLLSLITFEASLEETSECSDDVGRSPFAGSSTQFVHGEGGFEKCG